MLFRGALPRRAGAILASIVLLLALLFPGRAAEAQAIVGSGDYWHTDGTRIVDAQGRPVRIVAMTWYGMESSHWVPAGLDFQRYTTILDEVKLLGYNTVRLPFSNELVERNPVVRGEVAANLDLRGKRALQVLDAIVGYAHQIGLKIILDDHRSAAGRPMGINTLNEPLWYTSQYPESAWIRDWETLARRYRDNDAVIGFDLRNEPHTGGSGPWTIQTYLHQGATWGPYRGKSDPASDWRLAAERAGNAVLAVNPHLLIVVQGMQLYPDSSAPQGVDSSWWAGILTQVKRYPVRLRVPHQLVYSVHEYGPRSYPMPWFAHMTDASLQQVWHSHWSFLLDDPATPYAAPLWIGEFGTCTEYRECIDRRMPGNQATWFQAFIRFLREHPDVSWGFYALNGTNSNNCWADNGLLNAAWNNLASLPLQSALRSIQLNPPPLPAAAGTTQPLIPGATTTRLPRSAHSPLCLLP